MTLYHCWLEDLDHSEDIRDQRTVLTHEGNYGGGDEPDGGNPGGSLPETGTGVKGKGKGKGQGKGTNGVPKPPKPVKAKTPQQLARSVP